MSAPDPNSLIPFADPESPTLPNLWRKMVDAYADLYRQVTAQPIPAAADGATSNGISITDSGCCCTTYLVVRVSKTVSPSFNGLFSAKPNSTPSSASPRQVRLAMLSL